MGKHGPCYHCGVTNTPLWRNGPPEKPVLCNACGSRWRTKGTLANYTPLHARAEPGDFEDYRGSKVKSTPIRIKEPKVLKRKHIYDYSEVGVPPDYSHVLSRGLDEDTSNRSSSGSAVSNSESCAQFGGTELSDLTGPAQPNNTWETMVPSKKRTCVGRPKPSPVEKLTKDLCTILHEQQSSYFSGSSEEDLLFESDKPMVSVEIGHGSMLIRHPSSIGREEESEASSLSVDNKQNPGNEAYSPWPTPSVNIHSKGFNSSPSTGIESITKPPGHGMNQELAKRDKDRLEKLHMLGHHNSPLCYIDLNDIINFDEFTSKLTTDEQQQLLKCLPSVDTSTPPDSFRGMFESAQFKENLSCFQKLLAEGVLDNSLSGVKVEDCRTLKRFAMCYLTKSKWVEQYNLLKDVKCKNASGGFRVAGVRNDVGIGHSVNVKRSVDGQNQKISVAKTVMRSPKRVVSHGGYENKEENDGSCFSAKRLFALPLDTISPALESSDHELLLDVPSNGFFPQAELLLPSRFDAQASTSTSSVFLNRVHP